MRAEDSSRESVGDAANAALNVRRDERIAPGGDDRIAPGDESFSGAEKKQLASDGAGGSLGRRRLVAWAVAVLSVALIAVSAWFLLQPTQDDGVSAEGAQASQDVSLGASLEGRGSAEGGLPADAAAGAASGSSSAEDSASASGASGGSSVATAGAASSEGPSSASGTGVAFGSSASGASGSSSAGSMGSASSSASAGGSSSSSAASAGGSSASSGSRDAITISVSVSSSEADGSVSASVRPVFERGATAYDALCATGLSVNAQNTAFGIYVAAIGGLAEKDWGGASGWKYYVNGVDPSVSCGNYVLEDGDVVEWRYLIDGTARG